MGQKIKIEDKEYDLENLSDQGKATFVMLKFATTRIKELTNMQTLLQRAKNSYVESLKQEVLSSKAGLLLEND